MEEVKGVEVIEDLERNRGDLLFLSMMTVEAIEILPFIKKLKENYKIIAAGGSHPSGDPITTLKYGIDYVTIGEGEETIREIKERIEKNILNFKDVSGICHMERETIRCNPSKFVDINNYLPFSKKFKLFPPVEITRGCNFKCWYCETPRIFKKQKHRDVKNVLDIVKEYNRRGIKDLRFITPDASSYPYLEELLHGIKKINKNLNIYYGTFPSEIRPEKVNKELINMIKKFCKNDKIVIGAQSGSNRILKIIKREHTKEDVVNAVEISNSYGIRADLDFIIGFPDETEEDLYETIIFIKNLSKLNVKIHLHFFIPLPATPLFKKEKKYNIKISLLKEFEKLTGQGKLYGQWKSQMEQNKKIKNFYKQ